MNEKYILLEGTKAIELVSVEDFTQALLDNNTRNYNCYCVNFYEDYISLSAPLPKIGYGCHYTLVLTKEMCEKESYMKGSMREHYLYLLENDYMYIFEDWIREDERTKILDKIEKTIKKVKE